MSSPNPIMAFFSYSHLPAHLQSVSKPIGDLAAQMERDLPPSAETSAGLRKLLEAKDCFVRASLKPNPGTISEAVKAVVPDVPAVD